MLYFWTIIAGLVSFFACSVIIKKNDALGLVDIPNNRSSHTIPTPRGGGIGIFAGIIAGLFGCYVTGIFSPDIKYLIFICGFSAVALVGFFSDRFKITARSRILWQIIISLIVVFFILDISLVLDYFKGNLFFAVICGLCCVLWIVSVINFYNFMDGINTLAAMQAIIAGISIAVFGIILPNKLLIPVGFILAGSSFGFLMLNKSPAKIFMGDTGSYLLGFYIAGIGLMDKKLFIPVVLILGVFLFDAVFTLISRVIKKECWYRAHRSHFYQRAVKLGYSHMQVSAGFSIIMCILAFMAFGYLNASFGARFGIILGAFFVISGPLVWIISKEAKTALADKK
ncbi:MAG: hypothetical protein ABH869_00745 [Candidatus Omnitrophota bacterium]